MGQWVWKCGDSTKWSAGCNCGLWDGNCDFSTFPPRLGVSITGAIATRGATSQLPIPLSQEPHFFWYLQSLIRHSGSKALTAGHVDPDEGVTLPACIGSRFGHSVQKSVSCARLPEELGAVIPQAGICKGGAPGETGVATSIG